MVLVALLSHLAFLSLKIASIPNRLQNFRMATTTAVVDDQQQHDIGNSSDTISFAIPPLLSPFGSYPNLLQVTDEDRKKFHPVIIFPSTEMAKLNISDFTVPSNNRRRGLATEEERQQSAAARLQQAQLTSRNPAAEDDTASTSHHKLYGIGRYDEDRIGLYESDLFHDTSNQIDSFGGKRTIHMGIDLQAPVYTPVYSFWNGIVHAAGYNPSLGDYGHVIVIHHILPNQQSVYALYGHLDDYSTSGFSAGDVIQSGQVIGHLGAIHENGGWFIPHVHFQLSLHPPVTHDMPGAVCLTDRSRALLEYPDPRYILGPLY